MAENLWALREQKKLSVAALANRAGLPISLIMDYESGQRSIDPRHLGRLARALYVEESDIRLHSESRGDQAVPAPEHQPMEPPYPPRPVPSRPRERSAGRPKPPPRPPSPARPTQIVHALALLQRLGREPAEVEAELGKPLAELDRPAASDLIRKLQAEVAQANLPNRHRAYLPESVDKFEVEYLTGAQEDGAVLECRLFDGSTVHGRVIGFGPYSITLAQPDGGEITVNKLALVSYRKEPPA